MLELVNECGDKDQDVIMKREQEPAIEFLVDDVCANRMGARTIIEVSPKGSKGSNGVVERVVQSAEHCLSAAKTSFDERMGVSAYIMNPVLAWLREFVSYTMSRMEVSADGKTPYERVKGEAHRCARPRVRRSGLLEFHPGKKMDDINVRWGYRMFLGVRSKSTEQIIVDSEAQGKRYTRIVKRVPEEQRWSAAKLEYVTVIPWIRGQEDKEADGDPGKAGPGRQLTEEEKRDIKTRDFQRRVRPVQTGLRQAWVQRAMPRMLVHIVGVAPPSSHPGVSQAHRGGLRDGHPVE